MAEKNVKDLSKKNVENQVIDVLKTIMRHMFIQYSKKQFLSSL